MAGYRADTVCEDVGRSCGRALLRDRTEHEHSEIFSNQIKYGSVTVPVHEPGSYGEHILLRLFLIARLYTRALYELCIYS